MEGKKLSDDIGVNSNESKIVSVWEGIKACIKHKSGFFLIYLKNR
jgi:hypothetical protein